jgi:HEAT repeat protein
VADSGDRAVVHLLHLLADSDELTRIIAVTFLEFVSDVTGPAPLLQAARDDPAINVRRQALYVLGRLANDQIEQAFNALCEAASDPNEAIRYAALDALSMVRDMRAVGFFRKATTDSSGRIRGLADKVLQQWPYSEVSNA